MAFACQPAGKKNKIAGTPVKDVPYKMPVSVKFSINPKWTGAQFKKVVVDGDNNVYVLTDKGLYRDFPGNILSKDLLYSSLADKIPTDVCIQETTGYLYYLYPDRFLTNAHAGAICGHLPTGRYTQIAVNAGYDVLLVGDTDAVLFHRSDKKADVALPSGKFIRLYVHDNTFWYLTENAIYRLDGNKWNAVHKGNEFTSLAFSGNHIVCGTPDGYYVIDQSGKTIKEKTNRLPVPAITRMLFAKAAESDDDSSGLLLTRECMQKKPAGFVIMHRSAGWIRIRSSTWRLTVTEISMRLPLQD
jgi:hypothetical protein